ncbi:hypothetical protein V8E36_002766 [Tilletia maclaganii]
MAPKGNAKAVAGRARKAEAADNNKAAENAKKEAAEDAKWEQGAKGRSKADEKADKAAEQARKKAELDRLKREEEESLPKGPSEGKQAKQSAQSAKRDAKASTKATKAANSGSGGPAGGIDGALESFSADNIDDALDALTLVTEKTDSASRGSKAADIERHPERRFKAAFEAFKERRIPELRKEVRVPLIELRAVKANLLARCDEICACASLLCPLTQNPGLRLQQVQELAYKEFQKSEENPFNQVHLSYDADKNTRLSTLDAVKAGKEARLRDA